MSITFQQTDAQRATCARNLTEELTKLGAVLKGEDRGDDTDWSAKLWEYEATQHADSGFVNRDAHARVVLLENEVPGALYDRIASGQATASELEAFRQHAQDAGLSEDGTRDLIASASAVAPGHPGLDTIELELAGPLAVFRALENIGILGVSGAFHTREEE